MLSKKTSSTWLSDFHIFKLNIKQCRKLLFCKYEREYMINYSFQIRHSAFLGTMKWYEPNYSHLRLNSKTKSKGVQNVDLCICSRFQLCKYIQGVPFKMRKSMSFPTDDGNLFHRFDRKRITTLLRKPETSNLYWTCSICYSNENTLWIHRIWYTQHLKYNNLVVIYLYKNSLQSINITWNKSRWTSWF